MKPKPSHRVRIPLCSSLLLLPLAACSGSSGSGSGNHLPIVTISSPFTGNSFAEGDEVRLEGAARDPEDGDLSGASLEWSSDRDGPLGSGESLTTRALSLGSHGIRLTATDAHGASASAAVHIRIAAPFGSTPRAGEVNPYAGRLQRTPAKLDDELILVGRSNALDELWLGIVDVPVVTYEHSFPYPVPDAPRITSQRAGVSAVAAAAGRPLGSNLHQAAVLLRTSGPAPQFSLELVGLADPGEDRIAAQTFQPLFPDGPMGVAVADLDAFEENTGEPAIVPPGDVKAEYHDEVVLASTDLLNGDLVARIDVASFESVGFPLDDTAPLPGATSTTTTWTTQPMHPASRIAVRHGEALYGTVNPQLVVAYIDTQGSVAVDVFEYEHTRPDPAVPDPTTDARSLVFVQHAVLSAPLDAAAIAAGGWDVEVGSPIRLGMDMIASDVVLVVHNAGGDYVEEAWLLEGLQSPGPELLGEASGEFGRVPDGMGGEIGLTLLSDTRVRITLGRIVDGNVTPSCEALGIFVLADTNRGAVVQSLSAFVDDASVGNYRFGTVSDVPAWPHQLTIRNHPETTETTRTSLVAGGFVSQRNALIDYRGNPTGTANRFAEDCEHVGSAPLLGPMPSFYVADPEAAELHVVTMDPAGLGVGSTLTGPMDASLDERAILLAADATGDAAYYDTVQCAGSLPGDCMRVFLGDAELHYVIEHIETKSVLLQQPPKHIDHLPALGGIVDVSMRDTFFSEFVQTDQASGSVMRQTKTDWSIGARVELGLGPPAPPGEEFSSIFDMSLDAEHRSIQQQFSSSQVALSLTQTTGAVDDDVVWSKRQTVDYWRFPAQGGTPEGDPDAPSGFPDDAYMEIAIPDEPVTLIGPGTLNENYQPNHMVGNILSYPTFSDDADDLGELFNFLGSYVPSDANGTRQCKPLENGDINGCLILVNNALQRVAEVLAGDEFVGGEFVSITNPIDVADILQVGGISYSAELEFETTVKNGLTVTNSDTIKAEANLKIPLSVPVQGVPIQFGELEAQLRAAASFENSRISENAIGSKAKVALHLPSGIPVERSYQIQPSFGFTPGGSLQVSYQVNTDGGAATFWETHYSAPDPALNMPHRIVRTQTGFQLGTDFSRDKIKGFFVRDGEGIDPLRPGERRGDLLTEVPYAGAPLQLETRVTNLSVATEVFDLEVVFSLQEYENGKAKGAEIPIGVATIDFLPHRGQFPDVFEGHVASVFVLWDTTGFGPSSGGSLITYLVRVTLDPDDRVRGETHELFDRYDDPLLGPTGQELDPLLEKGQNNTGWAMVRLAPPLTEEARSNGSGAGVARERGEGIELSLAGQENRPRLEAIHGWVHEPLRLGLGLRSERPVLDYGLLQVFDGDPEAGGPMILSRTVQGISDSAVHEEFVWRPATIGRRVLHAIYTGTRAGAREVLQIPVIIGG